MRQFKKLHKGPRQRERERERGWKGETCKRIKCFVLACYSGDSRNKVRSAYSHFASTKGVNDIAEEQTECERPAFNGKQLQFSRAFSRLNFRQRVQTRGIVRAQKEPFRGCAKFQPSPPPSYPPLVVARFPFLSHARRKFDLLVSPPFEISFPPRSSLSPRLFIASDPSLGFDGRGKGRGGSARWYFEIVIEKTVELARSSAIIGELIWSSRLLAFFNF